MSSAALSPKPLRVSPLIRAARWSLLITGILYGMYYQKKFTMKENALREKELREKPMRDAKLAEEKRKAQEAEKVFLEELLNPKK